MNHSDFILRIKKLEALGQSVDKRFQWRLLGWLMIGYGYILGMVLLLLLPPSILTFYFWHYNHPIIALLCVGSSLGALIYTWHLFKIFNLKRVTNDDDRIEIFRFQTPQLFETLDKLAKQQKTKIHRVFINTMQNAYIEQHLTLGGLLPSKNYLTLGFPLLQTLDQEQVISVIAHEIGHLSGAHGKFGARLYAMRRTWMQLDTLVNERHAWTNKWLRAFLYWYVPRFLAETFVLARAQEYTADKIEADTTTPKIASESMINFSLAARWLDVYFWEYIFLHAKIFSTPNIKPFTLLATKQNVFPAMPALVNGTTPKPTPTWQAFMNQHETRAIAIVWLHDALIRLTNYHDSHPSLFDRLNAWGYQLKTPALPESVKISGAESLLGQYQFDLAKQLDLDWQKRIAAYWEYLHKNENGFQGAYYALLRKQSIQRFNEKDWLELAQAQYALGFNFETIKKSIQQALSLADDHPKIHHQLGLWAIEAKDWENANYHLALAHAVDPDNHLAYHQAMAQCYIANQQYEKANLHLNEHHDFLKKQALAQQEMTCLTTDDQFLDLKTAALTIEKHSNLSSLLDTEHHFLQNHCDNIRLLHKKSRLDETFEQLILLVTPKKTWLTKVLGSYQFLYDPHAIKLHEWRKTIAEQCTWQEKSTPLCIYILDHKNQKLLTVIENFSINLKTYRS